MCGACRCGLGRCVEGGGAPLRVPADRPRAARCPVAAALRCCPAEAVPPCSPPMPSPACVPAASPALHRATVVPSPSRSSTGKTGARGTLGAGSCCRPSSSSTARQTPGPGTLRGGAEVGCSQARPQVGSSGGPGLETPGACWGRRARRLTCHQKGGLVAVLAARCGARMWRTIVVCSGAHLWSHAAGAAARCAAQRLPVSHNHTLDWARLAMAPRMPCMAS